MIFATKLYFGKTSDQSDRSCCMVTLQKLGLLWKLVVTFVWYGCVRKTRCLPMFRIICQIPRCVLTWVMIVVAFCYDVLCEPCDGISDLLLVLFGIFMLHLGVCFWFGVLSVDWIFLVYVWGCKKDSFTLVVASQSLLGRWVEHLKFCLFSRTVAFYLGRGATWVVGLVWLF